MVTCLVLVPKMLLKVMSVVMHLVLLKFLMLIMVLTEWTGFKPGLGKRLPTLTCLISSDADSAASAPVVEDVSPDERDGADDGVQPAPDDREGVEHLDAQLPEAPAQPGEDGLARPTGSQPPTLSWFYEQLAKLETELAQVSASSDSNRSDNASAEAAEPPDADGLPHAPVPARTEETYWEMADDIVAESEDDQRALRWRMRTGSSMCMAAVFLSMFKGEA